MTFVYKIVLGKCHGAWCNFWENLRHAVLIEVVLIKKIVSLVMKTVARKHG